MGKRMVAVLMEFFLWSPLIPSFTLEEIFDSPLPSPKPNRKNHAPPLKIGIAIPPST